MPPPAPSAPSPRRPPAGAPPAPPTLPATADLRRLTRGEEGSGEPSFPPLPAALTRRPNTRLRHLRDPPVPVTPRRGAPPAPQPPGLRLLLLRPSAIEPPVPPGRTFSAEVMLRPFPPLGCDAGAGDADTDAAVPDPLGIQELYWELGAALPAERLRFHRQPLVEPAAAEDPRPAGERGPRNVRPGAGLFDDYLRFVAATGSDFLRAVFRRRRGGEEVAATPSPRPVPAPAPPYHKGLWKPAFPAPAALEPLQRRLGRLWAALGFPERDKLAMAVKYGTDAALARLPAALDAWETAAGHILRRERLLGRLERLEERSSDPGPFFHRGSASARAGERRARGRLRAALARCEGRLAAALRRLRDVFGDVVTFRGCPYARKMRRDAVEVLYRPQQRRRAGALRVAVGGATAASPPPPPRHSGC